MSVSVAVPQGFNLAGFITPSVMTGTGISLNGSVDLTNFFPVTNGGASFETTILTNAARYHSLNTEVTKGLSSVQLVSNDTEAALRTLTLVFVKE